MPVPNDTELSRRERGERRRDKIAWYIQAKSVPCFDCGLTFAPICMDFSHRDAATKSFSLSVAIRPGRYSLDDLLNEAAKCAVVCSNCHRLRHLNDPTWGGYTLHQRDAVGTALVQGTLGFPPPPLKTADPAEWAGGGYSPIPILDLFPPAAAHRTIGLAIGADPASVYWWRKIPTRRITFSVATRAADRLGLQPSSLWPIFDDYRTYSFCGRCREIKTVDQFHRDTDADGYRSIASVTSNCMPCCAAMSTQRRAATVPTYGMLAAAAAARRAWYIDAKNVPCLDCGRRFHPVCMDFDHRDPHFKEFQISNYLKSTLTVDELKVEAAKCDVVCSNCHRLRHQGAGPIYG